MPEIDPVLIEMLKQAKEAGVPVISAMGAGNKIDPSRFEVADIYETSIDPLARVMRRELKKRRILCGRHPSDERGGP